MIVKKGGISVGYNNSFGSYMTFYWNVNVLKKSGTSFLTIKERALAILENLKDGAENFTEGLPPIVAYLGILRTSQLFNRLRCKCSCRNCSRHIPSLKTVD